MLNPVMEIAESRTLDLDCNIYGLSTYSIEGQSHLLVATAYYLHLGSYNRQSDHMTFEKFDYLKKEDRTIHSTHAFRSVLVPTAYYWVLGIITLPDHKGSHIAFIRNQNFQSATTRHISYLPLVIRNVRCDDRLLVVGI